jgi:endonuclease/exonuclease/phosphatase family metal-dependent hydrolase
LCSEEDAKAAAQSRLDSDTDNPYAAADDNDEVRKGKPPPVIIATTHLKSSKSASGERYREKGVMQILNDTDRIYQKMSAADRTPAVLLLGDFNAVPEELDYPPLTYRAVKSHQLGLRR